MVDDDTWLNPSELYHFLYPLEWRMPVILGHTLEDPGCVPLLARADQRAPSSLSRPVPPIESDLNHRSLARLPLPPCRISLTSYIAGGSGMLMSLPAARILAANLYTNCYAHKAYYNDMTLGECAWSHGIPQVRRLLLRAVFVCWLLATQGKHANATINAANVLLFAYRLQVFSPLFDFHGRVLQANNRELRITEAMSHVAVHKVYSKPDEQKMREFYAHWEQRVKPWWDAMRQRASKG